MSIVRLPYCYQCGVPHVPDDVAARVRAGEKITIQIIAGSGVAANVLRWGTGAINVDGCRIESVDPLVRAAVQRCDNTTYGSGLGAGTQREPSGRWPANVLFSHSLWCTDDACDASCPVLLLGLQSGQSKSRVGNPRRSTHPGDGYGMTHTGAEYSDDGSAARFFYVAKASRSERNSGLDDLPERPLLWSAGTQNPGSFQSENTNRSSRNHHPTVKPIQLMRYLIRLVTPPGGIVLDPFCGSGTTACAAVLEGMRWIAIEREADYLDIATRRIAHVAAS